MIAPRFIISSRDAARIFIEPAEEEQNSTHAQIDSGFPTLTYFIGIKRKNSLIGWREMSVLGFQPKAQSEMNGFEKPIRTTQEMSINFFEAEWKPGSLKILTIPFYFIYI